MLEVALERKSSECRLVHARLEHLDLVLPFALAVYIDMSALRIRSSAVVARVPH
jgi:hypothetical protein